MVSVSCAMGSERLMKSLTGLKVREFLSLEPVFCDLLLVDKWSRYFDGLLKRAPGGGRKSSLETGREKLFFVLFYLKCYSTFDVMGFFFDLSRSNANRWIHRLLDVLEKSLGHKLVLPKRKIRSVEEFFQLFPEAKEVFIDGTERPLQRPKDKEKQKKNYSGKKKAHEQKNLVISDKKKRIGYLSPTHNGSEHDYRIFKEEIPPDALPGELFYYMDKGFVGICTDYPGLRVEMPKKKPKGGELTPEEKGENRRISSIRVLVEHAIGGFKRFKIMTDKFRNRKTGLIDKAALISAGLWNLHIDTC